MTGRSHAATFVIEDRGYLVGGTIGGRWPRRDVFSFDHTEGDLDRRGMTSGHWRRLRPLPPEMRERQQAVGFTLNIGEKYYGFVGTGWGPHDNGRDHTTYRDFWKYDPSKEDCNNGPGCTTEEDCPGCEVAWVQIASLPHAALTRRAATAFTLKVGDQYWGYVGFGFEDEPERNFLQDLWRYDHVNDRWEEVRGFSGEKRHGAMAFVIDNKAYIGTGANTGLVHDFFVFNPNAAGTAEDPVWRRLRQIRKHDPNADFDANYGTLGRSFGVSYVVDVAGELRGHIVGGGTASARSFTNWEYDHNADLWVERTSFFNHLSTRSREGMVSFSFASGRAFAGMGRSGDIHNDDFFEFLPLEEDYTFD
jgi:hypothetical protein